MTDLAIKLLKGAVSGFVAAVAIDISAWSKSGNVAFDWSLAGKRWISGALLGLVAASGMVAA